jgi:hypothetical protein
MGLKDYFNAVRGAEPPAGGDGKARTKTGEVIDLELYKFDS